MKKILSTILALFLLPATALAAPAFTVSQGGTGTGTPWSKYPLTGNGSSSLVASSTLWLPGINATGTSDALASTFVRARLTFSTTTNATTTNFFATTASTTNLFGSGLGACSGTSFLQWTAGVFGCASPAAVTGWSTTSQDYWNSQFRDWSVQGNGYLAPTTTRGILISALPSGSSTIPYLSTTFGTTTNATTTNLYNSSSLTATDRTSGFYGVVNPVRNLTLSTGTTTTWTASTSGAYIAKAVAPFNGTIKNARCNTDAGFLNVDFYHTSTHLPLLIGASSTVGTFSFSSNNTFTAGEVIYMSAGTTTTSLATSLACTLAITETP